MKKLVNTTGLIIICLSLIGCTDAPKDAVNNNSGNTIIRSQVENSLVTRREQKNGKELETQENVIHPKENKNIASKNTKNDKSQQPQMGTVTQLVNGDLMCYVTILDKQGIEYNVGATFDICAEEKKFLNKKVNAVYEIESINDCQSAEPCGKTRKESIITKMEVVSEDLQNQPPSGNSRTFSNGEWTITLSNTDSWSGVNGTGNVSYKGCDANGKCLSLTGGKVSCRDGKCVTGWKNGDYIYFLEQPMTEDSSGETTLIVRQGSAEILKATGLKVKTGN